MRDIRIIKLLKTRMIKKGQRDRPKMRKLKRLMKKYKYKGRRNFDSLQEINKELKSKEKEYTELKPSAKELYKKHLTSWHWRRQRKIQKEKTQSGICNR